jgi:UPF0755 protein
VKDRKRLPPDAPPIPKGKTPPPVLGFMLGFLTALLAFVLLFALAAAGFLVYSNAAPKTAIGPDALQDDRGIVFEYAGPDAVALSVLVTVNEGESSYAVGARLYRAGIIKNRYFWNILSRLDGAFVKAGTYRISLPATQMDIRSALVEGQQVLLSVTVPEGVTLKKAARIMDEAGICGADEFLAAASSKALLDAYRVPGATMEGYLYPDTYFFPGAFPAERVVRQMADTFFKKIRGIAPESAAMSAEELNNIVIIASIVEREYRINEEAAVMAGVFYNRVKISMPLQSCATVEYIITDIQGKPHPKKLYYEDIEIRHPYNTYVRNGLPPGPISLPGLTALDAAFHPANTNYLYFRLINEAAGRHYFSRTNDEHIRAGELFVKGY